jgi:hypothetical protein
MDLPINEKELNTIISAMRLGGDSALYQKLWTYKMDYMSQNKEEKPDGLSKALLQSYQESGE